MAKMGRPVKDVIKGKVVSVRMLPDEYEMVKTYADKVNKTVSEVMMDGVKKLIDKDMRNE